MKKENRIKIIITLLFGIYLLGLIFVLFIHNRIRYGIGAFEISVFSKQHIEMCNFIPFHTIITYFQRLAEHTINTNIVVTNLLVNLILFVPMGMAMPILFGRKFDEFWKFLIFIIIVTILVEVVQFITFLGSTDIDDVILNVIGGVIGYGIIQIKGIRKMIGV